MVFVHYTGTVHSQTVRLKDQVAQRIY